MWIPSPSGISGNELAELAAKSAAVDGIDTNIGLFYTEIFKQLVLKESC